jgi:hypothetical protein
MEIGKNELLSIIEKDVKDVLRQTLKEHPIATKEVIKEVPVIKEIVRTPREIEDNIETYVNLADYRTTDEILARWNEAMRVVARKKREDAIVKGLELLGFTGILRPILTLEEEKAKVKTMNEYQLSESIANLRLTIDLFSNFEGKVSADLERQIERNISNKEKIMQELALALESYQPKFEVVRKAIPFLTENLTVFQEALRRIS